MADNAQTSTQSSTQEKNVFKSKSFWLGMVTFTVSTLTYLQGTELIANHPDVVAGIGAAIGVAQIVLRLMTGTPVSVK